MKRVADGLIAFVKRGCPTCLMIQPVLRQLAEGGAPLTVYSQDDPTFPAGVRGIVDDRELEASFHFRVETVPTLVRVADGRETNRAIGWNRGEWEALSELKGLGPGLREHRPGCGSRTEEPGMAYRLPARFSDTRLSSRRLPPGGGGELIGALHQ